MPPDFFTIFLLRMTSAHELRKKLETNEFFKRIAGNEFGQNIAGQAGSLYGINVDQGSGSFNKLIRPKF